MPKTETATEDTTQDKQAAKDDKKKAIEFALSHIEKSFGKGAIMKLGQQTVIKTGAIPTGVLCLDLALGIGGVPRGRIVEVFGPESSGKTTLALSIIAEAQALKGVAAFVDAEHALDPSYAKKLGVNLDELLISQPDMGEEALEITEILVRSNAVDIVVIDSVAALVPRAELEGGMGDAHVGLQARLMSQALRKLTAAISRSRTCAVFINQLREKIGVMFGSPETTPGGRALKFYSSVRIDVRRLSQIKTPEAVIGSHVRAKVVKNKVAPPFREAEFDIIYADGIAKEAATLDAASMLEAVKKNGNFFYFGEDKIGQGRDASAEFLKQHPDLLARIEAKVRELSGCNGH